MKSKHDVFIINLKDRIDRRKHCLNQFKDKTEFRVTFVDAIRHEIGAIGLWQTMREIINSADNKELSCVIICEDDHSFTDFYKYEFLESAISNIDNINGDLLLGGVSHFEDAVQINQSCFWVNRFTGFQFAIVFKRFYKRFLALELGDEDNIDIQMKCISNKIFCVYPFISIQAEFGYSDVTKKNEGVGIVNRYFEQSQERLDTLFRLRSYFDDFK
jgi:glycosyl transferase family 25